MFQIKPLEITPTQFRDAKFRGGKYNFMWKIEIENFVLNLQSSKDETVQINNIFNVEMLHFLFRLSSKSIFSPSNL